MSSAAIVSLRMRLSAKARSSGIVRIEVMADHQHVEMLVDRVDREGHRRVGRGGDDVGEAGQLDDVGRMAAAGALGVEGVDRAALEGGDGVLDEAALVQRVGVDHHLHVHAVGDRQAAVDRGRRRAPVLVQLERGGAGLDLLDQRLGPAGVALAGEGEVDRQALGRQQHPLDMPGAGRAGGGVGAGRRAGAAADEGGDAAASASSTCCGQMKWICASMPPAVTILPSPAMISVPGPMTMSTPGWMSGLPALPIAAMRPSLSAMSAL